MNIIVFGHCVYSDYAKYHFYDFVRAFYAPKSLYKEIHDGRATPSWLCVLFIIGGTAISIKIEENISWIRSLIYSIFSVVTTGVIIFTFIR